MMYLAIYQYINQSTNQSTNQSMFRSVCSNTEENLSAISNAVVIPFLYLFLANEVVAKQKLFTSVDTEKRRRKPIARRVKAPSRGSTIATVRQTGSKENVLRIAHLQWALSVPRSRWGSAPRKIGVFPASFSGIISQF